MLQLIHLECKLICVLIKKSLSTFSTFSVFCLKLKKNEMPLLNEANEALLNVAIWLKPNEVSLSLFLNVIEKNVR